MQASGWTEGDNTGAARWLNLRIRVKPWRLSGGHIVVVPITPAAGMFFGIHPNDWLMAVLAEVKRLTDRPIRVHSKADETPLYMVLRDAWALVAYNSNTLVDSLIEGVPIFPLGPSAAGPMGSRFLCEIERPVKPDREPWLWWLAHQQWKLDEIKVGAAWAAIRERNR